MESINIDNELLLPQLSSGWKINTKDGASTLDNRGLKERFEINAITAMILANCDGVKNLSTVVEALCEQFPAAKEDIPADVETVLRDLHHAKVVKFTPSLPQTIFSVQDKTPPHKKHKLCIGMATYDDYDGVYFSVQAIRLYHPEILEDTEIIVIDNHPDGPCGEALKNLGNWVQSYRYIPCEDIKGTAVRDFIFREANADYVMCMDSHVFVQSGAIKQLLDYFEANPKTPDFLQGPLISDNMTGLSTHFKPEWSQGMYGTWGYDDRASESHNDPFEIPMQGLGLFACRRDAWQGFNPRFSGFGGEEGYIHEKFRQAGARTLCLPFLRWLHRFNRPMGTRYKVSWDDRIRNYMIGHHELGLDTTDIVQHFNSHLNEKSTAKMVAVVQAEIDHPFYIFDSIVCMESPKDQTSGSWPEIQRALDKFGVSKRVSFVLMDSDLEVDLARLVALRKIIQSAQESRHQSVLIFEQDTPPKYAIDEVLINALDALDNVSWQTFYLGSAEKTKTNSQSKVLLEVAKGKASQGVAFHHSVYEHLLKALPEKTEALNAWLEQGNTVDALLINELGSCLTKASA